MLKICARMNLLFFLTYLFGWRKNISTESHRSLPFSFSLKRERHCWAVIPPQRCCLHEKSLGPQTCDGRLMSLLYALDGSLPATRKRNIFFSTSKAWAEIDFISERSVRMEYIRFWWTDSFLTDRLSCGFLLPWLCYWCWNKVFLCSCVSNALLGIPWSGLLCSQKCWWDSWKSPKSRWIIFIVIFICDNN